jgi:hypothetical protein
MSANLATQYAEAADTLARLPAYALGAAAVVAVVYLILTLKGF